MPKTSTGLRYFAKGSPEAKAHMARLRVLAQKAREKKAKAFREATPRQRFEMTHRQNPLEVAEARQAMSEAERLGKWAGQKGQREQALAAAQLGRARGLASVVRRRGPSAASKTIAGLVEGDYAKREKTAISRDKLYHHRIRFPRGKNPPCLVLGNPPLTRLERGESYRSRGRGRYDKYPVWDERAIRAASTEKLKAALRWATGEHGAAAVEALPIAEELQRRGENPLTREETRRLLAHASFEREGARRLGSGAGAWRSLGAMEATVRALEVGGAERAARGLRGSAAGTWRNLAVAEEQGRVLGQAQREGWREVGRVMVGGDEHIAYIRPGTVYTSSGPMKTGRYVIVRNLGRSTSVPSFTYWKLTEMRPEFRRLFQRQPATNPPMLVLGNPKRRGVERLDLRNRLRDLLQKYEAELGDADYWLTPDLFEKAEELAAKTGIPQDAVYHIPMSSVKANLRILASHGYAENPLTKEESREGLNAAASTLRLARKYRSAGRNGKGAKLAGLSQGLSEAVTRFHDFRDVYSRRKARSLGLRASIEAENNAQRAESTIKVLRDKIRYGNPRRSKVRSPFAVCTAAGLKQHGAKWRRCVEKLKARGRNPQGIPAHVASNPKFKAALAQYHKRHGTKPGRLIRVRVPDGYPDFLVAYGRTPEIKYDAPKGSSKGKRIHRFGKRGAKGTMPVLVSSPERGPKFLALVAGTFKAKTDWLFD